jgi:hypothetical protein
LPSLQPLAAAQAALVFGGLGSWNGVDFDETNRGRYQELSARLHQLLNQAIVVAANSSSTFRDANSGDGSQNQNRIRHGTFT